MDSSRGGPLSTLILMLPVIIVPALVILRPPERDSGFGNHDLTAADSSEFPNDTDDFDSMFDEVMEPKSSPYNDQSAELTLLDEPLAAFEAVDPKTTNRHGSLRTNEIHPDSPQNPHPGPGTHRRPDLSRWGVTKSIWFRPGDSSTIGFAAFVSSTDQLVHYRFEAIGSSEQQVIRDVIHQIEEWQSTPAASSDPRAN